MQIPMMARAMNEHQAIRIQRVAGEAWSDVFVEAMAAFESKARFAEAIMTAVVAPIGAIVVL